MPLLPASDASDGGRFSYSVAASVRSAFEAAASRLEEQSGSRASYVATAKEDFKGHFSEVFEANAATARNDASALAAALRTVAGYVGQMIDAAHEEDARRKKNNDWVRRHNDRNLLEQAGDFFFGEEDRPNAEAGEGSGLRPTCGRSWLPEHPGARRRVRGRYVLSASGQFAVLRSQLPGFG